jgi:hypothetical protein
MSMPEGFKVSSLVHTTIRSAVLLLFLLCALNCQKPMSKAEWYPTTCCPAEFPVTIFNSYFLLPGGEKVRVPSNSLISNGWGAIGSVRVEGEKLKPLPISLEISWFSYMEDVFYSGRIDIPEEKLQLLFEKGFIDPVTKKEESYKYLIVGVCPGGGVSVWLRGNLISREILHSKVSVHNTNWSDFTGHSPLPRARYIQLALDDVMPKEQQIAIREQSIPTKWTDVYREDFQWKIQIHSLATWDRTLVNFYNGASELVLPDRDESTPRTIPSSLRIFYISPDSSKMSAATIKFDEEEIIQAFELVGREEEIILQLELSVIQKHLKASLKNKRMVLELTKTNITFHR